MFAIRCLHCVANTAFFLFFLNYFLNVFTISMQMFINWLSLTNFTITDDNSSQCNQEIHILCNGHFSFGFFFNDITFLSCIMKLLRVETPASSAASTASASLNPNPDVVLISVKPKNGVGLLALVQIHSYVVIREGLWCKKYIILLMILISFKCS